MARWVWIRENRAECLEWKIWQVVALCPTQSSFLVVMHKAAFLGVPMGLEKWLEGLAVRPSVR